MMANKKQTIDKKLLKSLEPFNGLSADKVDEIAEKSLLEDLPSGRVLFRQGEKDKRTIYLIAGMIELSVTGSKPEIVKAKTLDARHPIANYIPRPSTAKTKGNATILSIDTDLLEIVLQDNLADSYEVTELGADDTTAWMLQFLQSRAFLQLPTENIQAVLMRMEEVPVTKGEVIIRQGDNNDYYYVVQSGQCSVARRPAPKAPDVQLAILKEGDGFGEEALITNGKRNATITMLDDGVLMRLNKKDFLDYLAKPLINYTHHDEISDKMAQGCLLIDVRRHEEFMQNRVEGSVNLPLSLLRMKVGGLSPKREYILLSSDGSQSAAAAFLLTQHGLNCSVIKRGLNAGVIKAAANQSETEAKIPETRRSLAAQKTQKVAESKAQKISAEADTARKEAEQLAQRSARAADARRKAEQEIIRLKEEEKKRQEAARNVAHQQAKKTAERAAQFKQQAELAHAKAEKDLKKIEAAKHANIQKQKTLENSLRRAEVIAAESAKAAAEARKQAEKEAEEIRRRAQEEAERLRTEMESSRKKLEETAAQIQAQQEVERLETEKTTRLAQEEADEIRRQARQEADRIRAKMDAERKQLIKETAQSKLEEEQARREAVEYERARLETEHEEKRQVALRKAQIMKKEQARKIAEEIKAKLERAEQARKEAEVSSKGEGMALSKATIHRSKGKIILEGEEDIFIFKEPTATPEELEAACQLKMVEEDQDELPSFEVDTPNPVTFKPVNPAELSEKLHLKAEAANQKRKKHYFMAIAASVVIATGIGLTYFITTPANLEDIIMAKLNGEKEIKTKASLSKKLPLSPKTNKKAQRMAEKKVKQEASSHFNKLLKEWKKLTSASQDKE